MYFVLDTPHEITILGGVLLLTASHMLSQLLKCMCRSPDSWCACASLRSVVFFSYCNLWFPKPRYMNINELGMPRSLLLLWRTIKALVLHFVSFLGLRMTQPCKKEKERGASNLGNFRNKNKHNISPIIILLPPVSLTFFTALESLSSSSSTVPHRLHNQCVRWHQNAPEGASRTFKVLTLIHVKMINTMTLYVGPYGGNYY